MTVEPMNAFEYQRFYDTGLLPERFWPSEIARLHADFVADRLDIQGLEDNLEAMMGLLV